MATTSADLAVIAIDCLQEVGVDVALLHGVENISNGQISDVDLLSMVPADSALRRAAPAWRGAGLYPIILWPYDVGQTAAVFLSSEDASDGIQLDLLHDPRGLGKYGIRTIGLEQHIIRDRLPRLDGPASLVYQWVKRVLKGQVDSLPALQDESNQYGTSAIAEAAIRMTGSDQVAKQLAGDTPPDVARRPFGSRPTEMDRKLRRFLKPIGFWGHVQAIEIAEEMAGRFSRFVPEAWSGVCPSSLAPHWYWTHIRPRIVKPAIALTSGPIHRFPEPSVFQETDADGVGRSMVRAMSDRLTE